MVRAVEELRGAILERRLAGDSVGLVPTMGFLHDGHLSLARRARADNGCVVVSVFVNPMQFAPGEDYERYPRDERRDLTLLEQEGVDIAFCPGVAEMYPPGDATRVSVSGLTDRLEGASRPGHFDGVTTVVAKLLLVVGPARAYFGQKDAQQVIVIRRMMEDLFIHAGLVVCPTVRDDDGLALSSRNGYLSIEERHAAACLFQALSAARAAYDRGERSAEVLRARMTSVIDAEHLARIDYVSVADAESLVELQRVDRPALALVAVRIGRTRLIDNQPLGWDVA
ncbi:MAG: pantoate--beta-alanine ligase [Chloroflexota bacterium]|nr:pantoate--beta-alanine ligase [Chloroflexota bacterium]